MDKQQPRQQSKQLDPPPVWDLDFLQDWTVPVWTLDSLSEWTASLDELQSTWDQITDELEAPYARFTSELEAVYADPAESPDEAPLGSDEAERK